MAIQGVNAYTTQIYDNGYYLRFLYDQKYDLENNKSTLTITAQVYHGDYAPTYADGKVYINGSVVKTWQAGAYPDGGVAPNRGWSNIESFTHEIAHNQDGTCSFTLSIGGNNWGSFLFVNDAYSYTHASFSNASWNITLTTIPRASVFSSAGNVEIGSACNLKWIPNSSSFSYKIKFSLGSWTKTTDVISPQKNAEYTYTGYTIPIEVSNQLPQSISGNMTATIYTYTSPACTTQLGSESSITFTVTVPANVIPSILSAAATIDNSRNSVIRDWGVAVAGYTKVNLKSEARGSYGSTIVRFSISGGYTAAITESVLNWTGDYINSSGDKTFTIKAIDSRGRESEVVTTSAITFHPYSSPQNIIIRAERSPENEKKIKISAQWSISSVDGKNTAVHELKYRKKTVTSWTTYSGTLINGGTVELSTDFDTTSSYVFRLIVQDAVGNSGQQESMISTMDVLLDFKAGGKGVGIGKICESDAMEVALPAKFLDTVSIIVDNAEVSLADYIKGVMNGTYT